MAQRTPASTAARPSVEPCRRPTVRLHERRRPALGGPPRLDECEPGGRRAGRAGHGDEVTRTRSVAAEQGSRAVLAGRRGAEGGGAHAGCHCPGDVAAGDTHPVTPTRLGDPLGERIDITEFDVGAEFGGNQHVAGRGAHGGEVGDRGRDRAPADVGKRHRVASPVRALGERVDRSDGESGVDGPRGRVVARRHDDVASGCIAQARDDAVDQAELTDGVEGHSSKCTAARPSACIDPYVSSVGAERRTVIPASGNRRSKL